MKEPQYTLAEFDEQEGAEVSTALKEVLTKHSAEIKTIPVINPNGTLGSQVHILKRVELIPKEQGVPSPFIVKENGGNNSDTTENRGETA